MMTELIAVVATDEQGGIGKDNQLLWHLPNDLKHFKTITSGFPILMGRKTFESIGRVLPNRLNLILSRQNISIDGATVVSSLEHAIQVAQSEQIFVIGGGEIYQALLPHCSAIECTKVHATFEADTFFPAISADEWLLTSSEDHKKDERHAFDFSFERYERLV
jgi:dihydrofolate reductase